MSRGSRCDSLRSEKADTLFAIGSHRSDGTNRRCVTRLRSRDIPAVCYAPAETHVAMQMILNRPGRVFARNSDNQSMTLRRCSLVTAGSTSVISQLVPVDRHRSMTSEASALLTDQRHRTPLSFMNVRYRNISVT